MSKESSRSPAQKQRELTMSKINTHDLAIPTQMLEGWQHIVDLLAEIINVPSALIMRIHPKDIEVVSSSLVMPNPYTLVIKNLLVKGFTVKQ